MAEKCSLTLTCSGPSHPLARLRHAVRVPRSGPTASSHAAASPPPLSPARPTGQPRVPHGDPPRLPLPNPPAAVRSRQGVPLRVRARRRGPGDSALGDAAPKIADAHALLSIPQDVIAVDE